MLSGLGLPLVHQTDSLEVGLLGDSLVDIPLHDDVRRYLLSNDSVLSRVIASLHCHDGIDGSSEYPYSSSALCPLRHVSHLLRSHGLSTDAVSSAAIGLLYAASMLGVHEARTMLSYRFSQGLGVAEDLETAAFYGLVSAMQASVEFHSIGGEPVAERDRIDDNTEKAVLQGNRGSDDELIQLQAVQASEGHVPSMLAMGDLYYYGARGMPRDQAQARRYFLDAARLGSAEGMCGVAGMVVKGEGGGKNISEAVQWYETAARAKHPRALNGLGYLYFHGTAVDKNEV
jgi:TPR repeat protein